MKKILQILRNDKKKTQIMLAVLCSALAVVLIAISVTVVYRKSEKVAVDTKPIEQTVNESETENETESQTDIVSETESSVETFTNESATTLSNTPTEASKTTTGISTKSPSGYQYKGTAEQIKKSQEVAKSIADEIKKKKPNASTETLIGNACDIVHDRYWVNCTYNLTKATSVIAYGVFFLNEGCCNGTTEALGMVLDFLGIKWTSYHVKFDSTITSGTYAGASGHNYCKIMIDGYAFYADAMYGTYYYEEAYFNQPPKEHTCKWYSEDGGYSGYYQKMPTCTEEGVVELTCIVDPFCTKKKIDSVPALGHNYTEKIVNPGEAEQEYTVYTCSRCGYSYIKEATDAE